MREPELPSGVLGLVLRLVFLGLSSGSMLLPSVVAAHPVSCRRAGYASFEWAEPRGELDLLRVWLQWLAPHGIEAGCIGRAI